ncbi:alpha/beta hydrolase [Sphingomonas sp. BIUV-7]|uniref:Alpha/beta hydrolase n=1 Tax=Sphingomonas natans TaxID=3063330 RepID=A0ABT8Y751_9SPHN|nr:alpha/beta hydrolase [Sphingomonas sp. BIUV-7]MDO6414144.1 alpha/beta hydrolase [Sphingomonas sp. BIUV-7]
MTRILSCVVAAFIALSPGMAAAQKSFSLGHISAPDQTGAIPLYPASIAPEGPSLERWGMLSGPMGPDTRIVRNVTVPTITPVLPAAGKATGAAVIVAPGGAFLSLSMDSEGFEVAHRLADRGIAAFVLKYRTNPVPNEEPAFMAMVGRVMGEAARPGGSHAISDPAATADGLQALRLVRQRASEWHIDPARVGMIGFSAGAQATLQTVLSGAPTDMPAFIGYIYGPMEKVDVPPAAPPMFVALALDDGLFGRQGFGIVEAWHATNRPVEFHAYERGDHGFGTGRPGTTSTQVLPEFMAWLASRDLLTTPTRP